MPTARPSSTPTGRCDPAGSASRAGPVRTPPGEGMLPRRGLVNACFVPGALLHASPSDGLAEDRCRATLEVDGVLCLDCQGAGIGAAVSAIVKRALPLGRGGLLGVGHDLETEDRALAFRRIGVVSVGLLP